MSGVRRVFRRNFKRLVATKTDLTMGQLARDLKVSRQIIYKYLDGTVPGAEVLDRIAKYFSIEVFTLFK